MKLIDRMKSVEDIYDEKRELFESMGISREEYLRTHDEMMREWIRDNPAEALDLYRLGQTESVRP